MNNNNETSTIFSNEALRGKPYLDIDRVITEVKINNDHERNDDQLDT
ncbi:hypothetical protein J2Y03_001926 [Neobacillus niacini]|nr:hypothetical protein [Neobacillus niacini]MDR7076903.1 hypothetical protein [Neobacillus niacini]